MPLSRGCTRTAFDKNVKMLIEEEGRDRKQAYAIAHSVQQRACGFQLFMYGYLTPGEMIRLFPQADTTMGVAHNRDFGVYGQHRALGLKNRRGAVVIGPVFTLTKDEIEAVADLLEKRGYKRASASINVGRKRTQVATTFVAVSEREMRVNAKDTARIKRSVGPFAKYAGMKLEFF